MAYDANSTEEDIFKVHTNDAVELSKTIKALSTKKIPIQDLELIIEALKASPDYDTGTGTDLKGDDSGTQHQFKNVGNVLFIGKEISGGKSIHQIMETDLPKISPHLKMVMADKVPIKTFVTTITALVQDIKSSQAKIQKGAGLSIKSVGAINSSINQNVQIKSFANEPNIQQQNLNELPESVNFRLPASDTAKK